MVAVVGRVEDTSIVQDAMLLQPLDNTTNKLIDSLKSLGCYWVG